MAGPAAVSHQTRDNTITVSNSLLVGQTTNFDCVNDQNMPFSAGKYMNRRLKRPLNGMHQECFCKPFLEFFFIVRCCERVSL